MLPSLVPRRGWLRGALVLLLSVVSVDASAQARAWLDRDRIALGETVMLNVETTSATSGAPDFTPLRGDFTITGNTSRRQLELRNGRRIERTLYAVALQPRREGLLSIPSLRVGGERTQPLSLLVTAGSARTPARAGDDAFIESEADDQDPYVQQAVGWVVRLYSLVPLVSGQIDQPAPDGAALRRIGDDAQYTRQIDGRRYTVIERRYQLIPERSGTLTIPGASFQGRGASGFFDDFFGSRGGRGGVLQAQAPPRFLEVRPVPDDAPQPWLPLQDLQLRYRTTPQELRAGAAATLTIEASADGATAAQMPELQLPAIDGVQVFAEPVQADERLAGGRPQVTLTRRFSLVPERAGAATLDGLRLPWWDVRSGSARTATLPPLSWQVAAGDDPAPAAPPAVAGDGAPDPADPVDATSQAATHRGWTIAAVGFAALWLVTLLWALQRRMQPAATPPSASPRGDGGDRRAANPGSAALRRALDTGDLGEVGEVLCAMARPPVRDLDQLVVRLDDPDQREAVAAMQRARWGGGDGVAARARLRAAFAQGPRWRAQARSTASPLPPLYPDHPDHPDR